MSAGTVPALRPMTPPAVEVVAVEAWTDERREFIRKTYCAGAPDGIVQAFLGICERRGLAPEERHIYLVQRAGTWVIQTGIDGYRLIAERTGHYVGSDDYVYDAEDGAHPTKATVTVWKLVAGVRCPFTASARWAEYAAIDKRSGRAVALWATMPYLMLGKCAEALALRKAFPAQLAGIYTREEMDQAKPQPPVPLPPEDDDLDDWIEAEDEDEDGDPAEDDLDEAMAAEDNQAEADYLEAMRDADKASLVRIGQEIAERKLGTTRLSEAWSARMKELGRQAQKIG